MIARSTSPRSPNALRALGVLGALSLLSCRDLESFDSKPGQVYCGGIIVQPAFQDGFIKDYEPPDLELGLTLDIDRLTSQPGLLSSNNSKDGMCAPLRLFEKDTPLRAIPEVDHDVLSALTFGEGHLHDFFAWVDSTCLGTMLAVVSLMKNNQVEVRLFKPARVPPPNASSFDKPGFAVFHLVAQQRSECDVYKD